MYSLGQGVPQDYTEAIKWYRKAAEQGDAAAQNHVGLMYAQGQGVSQNFPEAAKWWRQPAEIGYAKAQYNLGLSYERGQGASQDTTPRQRSGIARRRIRVTLRLSSRWVSAMAKVAALLRITFWRTCG